MKYKGRTRFGERRVGDEVKPRLKPDSIHECKAVKNKKKRKYENEYAKEYEKG